MVIKALNIDSQLVEILGTIADPEIPVLSILEMGIICSARVENGEVLVNITPTYSGCPAMDVIAEDITKVLKDVGYKKVRVALVLTPAWSTDMITEKGRLVLEKYGIAPPLDAEADKAALLGEKKIVKCTLCDSTNTKLISQFGSTACKALFQCEDCHEPFDYFKCLK